MKKFFGIIFIGLFITMFINVANATSFKKSLRKSYDLGHSTGSESQCLDLFNLVYKAYRKAGASMATASSLSFYTFDVCLVGIVDRMSGKNTKEKAVDIMDKNMINVIRSEK